VWPCPSHFLLSRVALPGVLPEEANRLPLPSSTLQSARHTRLNLHTLGALRRRLAPPVIVTSVP
jgi:hypothetical protein